MEEENQQELIFKLSMFEQHANQLQQQIRSVEKGILDLNELVIGLEELNGKENEEMLAHVGRGIFIKTKIISEELIVDVGSKNFVKKTIPEAKKLIGEQIKRLETIKEELNENLEDLGKEMQRVLESVNSSENKEE